MGRRRPTHLGTVTPSGRPISIQTVARIRTHALGDPKSSRAQAVPLYHGDHLYTFIIIQHPTVEKCVSDSECVSRRRRAELFIFYFYCSVWLMVKKKWIMNVLCGGGWFFCVYVLIFCFIRLVNITVMWWCGGIVSLSFFIRLLRIWSIQLKTEGWKSVCKITKKRKERKKG